MKLLLRLHVWLLAALLLLLAPRVFGSGLSIALLSQIGIATIACLSFNILLGQGGMLSFGHAVYSGLGAYVAMHGLNILSHGAMALPVCLVPLLGGCAGMGFAILLGFISTRKAGTAFAMITLGLGELVFAMALMLPEFSGGEGGVSGNRVVGEAVWGISFGPALQVYYLIAVYTWVCVALMYTFTLTPLGRLLNAVRDNAQRVEFIGYNPQRVRYLSFVIAGFFAGIAGGLGALNFEIVNAEVVGAARSGAYLLFTFLGGCSAFYGPILGAVLMVLTTVLLSEVTKAWLLYLGLAFMLVVLVAPGGIAGVLQWHGRLLRAGIWQRLWPAYVGMLVCACEAFTGFAAAVEMLYARQLDSGAGTTLSFWGLALDSASPWSWVACVTLLVLGGVPFRFLLRRFQAELAAPHPGVAGTQPSGLRPTGGPH